MSSRRLLGPVVAVLFSGVVHAAELPRDVSRILEQMEREQRSASLEYVGQVVVTSRGGAERRKSWVSFREGSGRAANLLIRFLDPPEVRGVAFLSLGHTDGSPDQWMYLPSMKRERRLAPLDRDASFVGTDFSYADLREFDRSEFTASLEADQIVDGEACYTVRLVPRGRSPFTLEVLSVSQSRFIPRRISYFRQGRSEPAKELSLLDYRQHEGHWVALRVEMTDAVKNSRTVVLLTDVRVDRPQPPDRYTLQNLVREGADVPRPSKSGKPPSSEVGVQEVFNRFRLGGDEPAQQVNGILVTLGLAVWVP